MTRSRETIIAPVTMALPLPTPILTITPIRKSMLFAIQSIHEIDTDSVALAAMDRTTTAIQTEALTTTMARAAPPTLLPAERNRWVP